MLESSSIRKDVIARRSRSNLTVALLLIALMAVCRLGYADTITYYFNSYDEGGEEWPSGPEYMVDGGLLNSASSGTSAVVQLCNGNTNDGKDLGPVTKVELRAYAKCGSYSDGNKTYLRPVFTGGDGDNHDLGDIASADWSLYHDITTDTNAPGTWTWSDVQNLDCSRMSITGLTRHI